MPQHRSRSLPQRSKRKNHSKLAHLAKKGAKEARSQKKVAKRWRKDAESLLALAEKAQRGYWIKSAMSETEAGTISLNQIALLGLLYEMQKESKGSSVVQADLAEAFTYGRNPRAFYSSISKLMSRKLVRRRKGMRARWREGQRLEAMCPMWLVHTTPKGDAVYENRGILHGVILDDKCVASWTTKDFMDYEEIVKRSMVAIEPLLRERRVREVFATKHPLWIEVYVEADA